MGELCGAPTLIDDGSGGGHKLHHHERATMARAIDAAKGAYRGVAGLLSAEGQLGALAVLERVFNSVLRELLDDALGAVEQHAAR